MPKYNPNSIWESKAKKYEYTPPASANPPAAKKPAREVAEAEPPRSHAVIWWAVGIFVLLVGGGAAYLFFRPTAGPNVSISFSKPDQVLVGDPFSVSVSLTNDSANVLNNATLSVTLPNNVSFVGQPSDEQVLQQELGDIGPGSVNKQDFTLIVTGDPSSVKHISAKLTYNTDQSAKSNFETDGGVDVVVGGPAISLNISPPSTVFSGQGFSMTVTYNNNTSHNFNNVILNLQYPPVFTFTGASMAPANPGNNSWDLGTIPPAGSGSITITGNVVGPQGTSYSIGGSFTGSVQGTSYTLSQATGTLAIGTSPLSLAVTVNNSSNYVAGLGSGLTYTITYTNNSSVTFQNLALKAALMGAMYDFTTLQTQGGSFNSVNDTISWNGSGVPTLLTLAPGQSGSVSFMVQTKSSYPIRLLSDKNYTLDVNATISSPTVPPGTTASSTVSAISAENKVGGKIALAAEGFWRDASSGILNSGPFPPKVNQTTEYTIHWVITNYSTDAQNVTVSAALQSGTTCTGNIKSNVSTSPVCNAANGTISWTIPVIPATTGITDAPAEAIIQVENTPAVNQVGNTVTLLGPTTLTATDAFTSSTLTANAQAVTTNLTYDKTVATQGGQVTQ